MRLRGVGSGESVLSIRTSSAAPASSSAGLVASTPSCRAASASGVAVGMGVDMGVANAAADPPVYIGEQRPTVHQGLRILARIIARAHLRREADRSSAPVPDPPSAVEPRD